MPRPLTPEKQRRLLAMADRGDDAYGIAAALGCSVQTVRRYANQPVDRAALRRKIQKRLTVLAAEMHEVSAMMSSLAGRGKWAEHSNEMAGAANIATQWAKSISGRDA